MRGLLLLGAVFFISVSGAFAAPTDDGDVSVPIEAEPEPVAAPIAAPVATPVAVPADAPVAAPDSTPAEVVPGSYRKETSDTLSKQTSEAHSKTKTKEKVKVITKHLKNGGTVTIIKDKSKTKTKKDLTTDDFNQSNHTLTEGGPDGDSEESDSLTTDKKHHLKETDVTKKTDTERIVRDKYGNVVSDTHKTREKDKVKKKEKDTETKSLVHTVKSVPPPVIAVDPTEAPAPAPADPPADDC